MYCGRKQVHVYQKYAKNNYGYSEVNAIVPLESTIIDVDFIMITSLLFTV